MKRILASLFALFLFPAVAFGTVTTTQTTVSYSCNGSTGPYSFSFPATDSSAIIVSRKDSNGLTSTLSSSDYTISPVNNHYANGGSITLSSACASGYTITISRETPITQDNHFYDYMPALYETFESSLDKLAEIQQEQQYAISLLPSSPITVQSSEIATNLSALQALPVPTVNNTSALMLGRTVVGDGGQGVFVWSSSDHSADVTNDPQHGIYIPPFSDRTGASGCWVRLFTGLICLDWFGASPSATASANATAIQAVINYAYSLTNGAELKFGQAATYSYDTGLVFPNNATAKVAFEGVAPSGTILSYTGTGDAITLGDSALASSTNSAVLPLTLKNFQLTTSTGTDGILSVWRFNQGVKIENVYVNGFSGRGFWIKGKSWTNLLLNCLAQNNGIGFEVNANATTLLHCDGTGNTTNSLAIRRDTDTTNSVIPAGVNILGGSYEQSSGSAVLINGVQGLSFSAYVENGYSSPWTSAVPVKITSAPVNGQNADCLGMNFNGPEISSGSYANAIELDATAGSILGLSINGTNFSGSGLTTCIKIMGGSPGGINFHGYYPGTAVVSGNMSKIAFSTERTGSNINIGGRVTATGGISSTGPAVIGASRSDSITGTGQTIIPSYGNGNLEEITVTTADAFTIANATGSQDGAKLTIAIYNTSGGAMGAITWGDYYVFNMSFTAPANGKVRMVTFEYTFGKWHEIPCTADQAY